MIGYAYDISDDNPDRTLVLKKKDMQMKRSERVLIFIVFRSSNCPYSCPITVCDAMLTGCLSCLYYDFFHTIGDYLSTWATCPHLSNIWQCSWVPYNID